MKKQNYYVENRKRLIIASLILATFVFTISTLTVSCTPKGAGSDKAAYYHQLEKEYIQNARNIMNENGYYNAGVTMNRCMQEDGSRLYTVKVHHSRLNSRSQIQVQKVYELLDNIPFEDGKIVCEII